MATGKPLLRVLSCGSVDDGKSTLIGRMLHDSGILYEDQLELLEKERTAEGLPDFSCLLDGLLSEREQAITIDVAYRSFRTETRRYIVADAPGHEQYTRNMVTGASRSDVALLLIDAVRAKDGLLPQTIRHSLISSLLGIPDVVVAVNKMDLCGYDEAVFARLRDEYRIRLGSLPFRTMTFIPVSALRGDNVCNRGTNTPWYNGPTLIECLEGIETPQRRELPFRMPVQWVAFQHGFRGLAGTVVAGTVKAGEEVAILPSRRTSRIKRIVTLDGDLEKAEADDAVCIQLADDLDVGRGEVVAEAANPPEVADQFSARMIWLNSPALMAGRTYICRMGMSEVKATVTELSSKLNLQTISEQPAKELNPNDVGRVKIALDRPLPFMPYSENRDLGGLLLIDRFSGNTLGAGIIEHSLRRSHNVYWHEFALNKTVHAEQKMQRPGVLWFTGLSASGKSTIANLAAKMLHARGKHVYILDGDNLRHGLNKDLGFTEADRAENVRRASEAAHLLVDAGLVVLAAFISPYRTDRAAIRERFAPGEFAEIFVDTPLEICMARDPKKLYAKAKAGELPNFTGVTAPFEEPVHPDLHLNGEENPEHLAEQVVELYLAGQSDSNKKHGSDSCGSYS